MIGLRKSAAVQSRFALMLRFVFTFALAGVLLQWIHSLDLMFWQQLLAQHTVWLLQLFGLPAFHAATSIVTYNFIVFVVPACLGVPGFLAFCVLVIGSAMPYRYLAALPLLWFINVLRLATSFVAGAAGFETVHFAWRFIALALVFGLWYWLYLARPLDKAVEKVGYMRHHRDGHRHRGR